MGENLGDHRGLFDGGDERQGGLHSADRMSCRFQILWSRARLSGVMELLRRSGVQIEEEREAVLGWSDDVGKPQDVLLTNANATVTYCHDKTRNLVEITRQADIVVAAIGRTAMVTRDFIKPGRSLLMLGLTKYSIPPRFSACSVKMNRVGRTFRNAVTSGWAMCTNDPSETWHRC